MFHSLLAAFQGVVLTCSSGGLSLGRMTVASPKVVTSIWLLKHDNGWILGDRSSLSFL